MSVVKVPYETAEERGVTLDLMIPETCKLLSFIPEELPVLPDAAAAVVDAVENPLGSKKFSELTGKGKTILFMIENQFRAAPANVLLPPLVKMAQDAGSEVKIIIATGKVGPLNEDEIKEKILKAINEVKK